MKRGMLILFLLSFVLSLVFVNAELEVQDVSLISWVGSNPSFYEFTSQTLRISIWPDSNSTTLTEVSLNYDGVNVTSYSPSPATTFSTSKIVWENKAAPFSIQLDDAVGKPVNSDQVYTFVVSTTDSNGKIVSENLPLTIKNDNIAPRYSLNNPQTLSIVKNASQLFSITVTEEESGLNAAKIFYDYYNMTAESSITQNEEMVCGTDCTTTINLIPPTGKNYFGFLFNLSDKAGNQNITSYHWLFIDNLEPEITLNTPTTEFSTSASTYDFYFTVNDNAFASAAYGFSPSVTCSLYVDEIVKDSTTEINNGAYSLTASFDGVDDGYHSWYIACTDTAGWEKKSETGRFLLDTTGPNITRNSPEENTPVLNGTLIDLSVVDNYLSVASVWYTLNGGGNTLLADPYNIDTSSWPYGTNTLVVYANDSLGNTATKTFTFIIDNRPPTISLFTPFNDTFNNNAFTFNATDEYWSLLECDLVVDGEHNPIGNNIPSKSLYTYNANLLEGQHNWSVWCQDILGNSDESESWVVTIDTTKPVVTLTYPSNFLPFSTANINTAGTSDFNYNFNEAKPQKCILYINSVDGWTDNGLSNFTNVAFGETLSPRNDPYIWYVQCTDLAGNKNDAGTGYVYYDNSAPVISNIANSSIDSDSAIISWNTGEKCNHTVYYSDNLTLLQNDPSAASSKTGDIGSSVSITVEGLSATTTYYFLIESCDQFKKCTTEDNGRSYYSFSTSSTPPANPSSSSSSSGGGGGGGGSRLTKCNDKKDNDGDGLIDLDDPGCGSINDDDERNTEVLPQSCTPNWKCTQWSDCSENVKTRSCQDWSLCGMEEGKPSESESCEEAGQAVEVAGENEEEQSPLGLGQATGLFDKIKENWIPIVSGIGLLALLGLVGWKRRVIGRGIRDAVTYRKRRREEENIRKKLEEMGLLR